MAMLDFEEQKKIITLANEFDVCIVCADKLAKEKGITLSQAKKELEGKLTNNQVVKFTDVTTSVICKDCIKEFHDKLFGVPAAKEETAEIDSKKESTKKEVKTNETKSSKTKK